MGRTTTLAPHPPWDQVGGGVDGAAGAGAGANGTTSYSHQPRSHHRHDGQPHPPPDPVGARGGLPVNAVAALLAAAKAAFSDGSSDGKEGPLSGAELGTLVRLAAAIPLSQLGLEDPTAVPDSSTTLPSSSTSSDGGEGGLTASTRRLSLAGGGVSGEGEEPTLTRPAKRASPPRAGGEEGEGAAVAGAGAAAAAPGASAAPQPAPPPPITYLHISEDPTVSLGVFCLPPGAVIPLHNHPGMTVVSRVLYGSLAVRSFDWVEGEEDGGQTTRTAALVADRVLTPADPPTLLRPSSGGNIHAFASVGDRPTAVLDLLAPPYSGAEGGRDCMYFREEGEVVEGAGGGGGGPPPPTSSASSPGGTSGARAATAPWPSPDPARPTVPGTRIRLVEVPAPPGFTVEHGPYRGVQAEPGGGEGRGGRVRPRE